MQKRLISLVEAVANTGCGFAISVAAGAVVYPLFGARFSLAELSGITAIFTVLSIGRGYLVRRVFNWTHVKGWW